MITEQQIKSLQTLDMILAGNLIRLISVTENLFEPFDHVSQDPFTNGITANGIDEGSMRGWGCLKDIKDKYNQIIKELTR